MAATFGGQIGRAGMAAKQVCAQAEGGGPGGRYVLQVGAEGIAHQLADGAAFLGAALAQLMFQLGGQLDGGGHGSMDPDEVIRMVLLRLAENKRITRPADTRGSSIRQAANEQGRPLRG